jgi:hypothetical protein
MKKKIITKISAIALAWAPSVTFAAVTCTTPKDFATLFDYVLCIIVGYVTPFLFGLGGLIFIMGVLNYVRAGDDVEKRAAGRDLMWFGIIALFVMLSVWGFVRILTQSFFAADPAFQSLPKRATSVFAQ